MACQASSHRGGIGCRQRVHRDGLSCRRRVQPHLITVHRHPTQRLPVRLVHLRQLLGAVGLAAQLPPDARRAELVVRQDHLPASRRPALCVCVSWWCDKTTYLLAAAQLSVCYGLMIFIAVVTVLLAILQRVWTSQA